MFKFLKCSKILAKVTVTRGKFDPGDQKIGSCYRGFHLSEEINRGLLRLIQGTEEIGFTKRKFHLSGVPLIERQL